MSVLPIVQRELRAAARRKGTYRIRTWTALAAMVVSFVSLTFMVLAVGRGQQGAGLFANLTSSALGLCLLAGIFLTADCLSEEKREGTIGLLFLTDLRGYDVVLGKFTATLVNAMYGLLALLPVLSISLLLGGVTGGEFWRKALALINALFVSLAAGMWISARSRQTQQAMGGTLVLMLLLAVALPTLAAFSGNATFLGWISCLSPRLSFSFAAAMLYPSHVREFWGALLGSHLLGWLFLIEASRKLPRNWQERDLVEAGSTSVWKLIPGRWRSSAAQRLVRRRKLLPINPVLWMISRNRAYGGLAWLLALISAAVVGFFMLSDQSPSGSIFLQIYQARPLGFLLKGLFAVQACRFFIEARKSGALEMLLSTPLSDRAIVRGQALALRRAFLGPVMVFIGLLFVPVAWQLMMGLSKFSFEQLLGGGFGLLASGLAAIRTITDLLAVFYVGLWLSLTMKQPALAPVWTIVLVLVLPSVLCAFDIVADLFLILYGTTKLQQDFRWVLAQRQQQLTAALSTSTRATSSEIPPIIGA